MEEILKRYGIKAPADVSIGEGWYPLVEKLIRDLLVLQWDKELFCIKEKFGGLRFYIGSGSDALWGRIHQSERDSYEICKDCGLRGKLHHDGWWRTLCDDCHAKWRERRS